MDKTVKGILEKAYEEAHKDGEMSTEQGSIWDIGWSGKVMADLKSLLKSKMPNKREVNTHEFHGEMDGSYCYKCQECYDEEKEPLLGNSLFNQAIDQINQVIDEVMK